MGKKISCWYFSLSVRAGVSSAQISLAMLNTAQPFGQPVYMVVCVMTDAISAFVTP